MSFKNNCERFISAFFVKKSRLIIGIVCSMAIIAMGIFAKASFLSIMVLVTALVSAESPYMQLFGGEYISRLSCERCGFKGNSRFSDITLGDFWGIWDIHPDIDDNEGVSAVVVNTKKGEEILSLIRNCLFIKEVAAEEICMQNPSFNNSSVASEERNFVLRTISEGNIDRIIEGELLKSKKEIKTVSPVRRLFSCAKRVLLRDYDK